MAISAYMKVSSKRFIDRVPMLIQYELVAPFVTEIKNGLNLSDEELECILLESDRVKNERIKLHRKLDSLKVSKKTILKSRIYV